ESELKKPGIMLDRVWITKIAYYVPSFARFYHDKKRYAEERAALRVMYEFLGQRGPDWHFQWIDNLVLDGKLEQARSALAALQRDFPAHYKARLAEGLLLRAEGNREGALDAMIEAVQIRPDAFRPRLELAATYRAAGEPDHFKEELTQARKNAGTLRDLHLLQNRFPRDLQAVARQVF
nr:hypothetical protein [Nitrospinaceae bacterium]NIR54208.1 hypothetical protein [Nitrospinaceae bacterium]NIS84623.1 hypothetical protein [Nitrospinaceae bacterium]NIT81418.1 hypothetical protein [Nitrospinaceae bacterium]NIU43702.1 hypothetical protein [Nitrospinaceae bacterium]